LKKYRNEWLELQLSRWIEYCEYLAPLRAKRGKDFGIFADKKIVFNRFSRMK
jgi:hypothetical protein